MPLVPGKGTGQAFAVTSPGWPPTSRRARTRASCIGFVDAYQATANNVVFGSSKSAALQDYLSQLATEGNANGAAPDQGGQYQTVTGKIGAVGWDITGGQKYWYITLAGQPGHVYVGTVTSVGPAQPGDPVTVRILDTGARESTTTMQSFTDTKDPLQAPGS